MTAPPTRRATRPVITFLTGGCVLAFLCSAVVVAGVWLYSQPGEAPDEPAVEYVLDVSPRMALPSEDGTATRLAVARSALAETVRPANASTMAGLRIFGGGVAADACQDTDLIVPLAVANQSNISDKLSIVRVGASPQSALVQALLSALRDLAPAAGPKTVVVVTGGSDSCSAQAEALLAEEGRRSSVRLHVFVIGYMVLPHEAEALRGLVEATGSGTYIEVGSASMLLAVLKAVQDYVDYPGDTPPDDVLATVAANKTDAPPSPPPVTNTAAIPSAVPSATVVDTDPSAGSCDHPYFPLRSGATWTFASAEGSHTFAVTSVSGGEMSATATMLRDGTDTITWECTAEGLAVYTGLGGLNGVDPQSVGWDFMERSGVWLPPPGDVTVGATWTFRYAFEEVPSTGSTLIGYYDLVQNFHAVGFEDVSVNGEALPALRVDSTLVLTPRDYPPGTGQDRYWFVHGIGPVRVEQTREFSTGPSTETFELVDYAIP